MKSNSAKDSSSIFWPVQIIGWSLFGLLNLIGRQYFVHYHMSELINTGVLCLSLITSTALLRKYYQSRLRADNLISSFVQFLLGSIIAGAGAMLLFALIIIPNQEAIFNTTDSIIWQQILMGSPAVMLLAFVWSCCYGIIKKQRLLKASKKQQSKLNLSLKEARLDVLLSQINPHFIFNAINNIRALILEDSDKARDMLADLSEVMRYTMQIDKEVLITLQDELSVVHQYVALNKLQFEDKLKVEYKIADESLTHMLPPMLLQLLVENAIKHGIGKLKYGGVIKISSQIYGSFWQLRVENSGKLLPQSEDSSGIGITNIKQRLQLMYRDKSKFEISESELGVLAKITIPLFSQKADLGADKSTQQSSD